MNNTIDKVYKLKSGKLITSLKDKDVDALTETITLSELDDDDERVYWMILLNSVQWEAHQDGILFGIKKLVNYMIRNLGEINNMNADELFVALEYLYSNFDYVTCPDSISDILKLKKIDSLLSS